jgi:hypothetical protein
VRRVKVEDEGCRSKFTPLTFLSDVRITVAPAYKDIL